MLTAERIRELLGALNEELETRDVIGEICLCGGAVMCLVYKARPATKDIDGIFEPTSEIRSAARAVAKRFRAPADWLNDAAKGFFLSDPPRVPVLELTHLRVWAPTAEYMLAMKCVSARFDSHDRGDVSFLIGHLDLGSPTEVLCIIRRFYPRDRIPAKAQFLVEELFE